MSTKQIINIELNEGEPETIQEAIMEEYKKLNDKCDLIIKKIKVRKSQKKAS